MPVVRLFFVTILVITFVFLPLIILLFCPASMNRKEEANCFKKVELVFYYYEYIFLDGASNFQNRYNWLHRESNKLCIMRFKCCQIFSTNSIYYFLYLGRLNWLYGGF